jgi:hypothetical protein
MSCWQNLVFLGRNIFKARKSSGGAAFLARAAQAEACGYRHGDFCKGHGIDN